jgi:hypothetical protein
METDWAENRAKINNDVIRRTLGKVLDSLYSTPERDKFRTRLETGAEAGQVEIYISHRGMMEIYPDEAKNRTIWQPRPADPELEAEFLQRLMIHLGADEARAKAQIAAQPKAEKARLQGASGGVSACSSKKASIAPGAALALPWTGWVSPSKTGIAPRAVLRSLRGSGSRRQEEGRRRHPLQARLLAQQQAGSAGRQPVSDLRQGGR